MGLRLPSWKGCYVPSTGEAVLHLGHTYRDDPQHHRLAEALSKTRKQGFLTSAEVTNTNGSSSSSFSNIKKSCCCDDINLRANESGCCTSSSSKPAATTNHQDPAGDATSSRHRGYKRGTPNTHGGDGMGVTTGRYNHLMSH